MWKIFWDLLAIRNERLVQSFISCSETIEWNGLAISGLEWSELEFRWRHNFISNPTLSFIAKVALEAKLDQTMPGLPSFLFLVSQMLVHLKELKLERPKFLHFATKDIYFHLEVGSISADQYFGIVSSLPTKWYEKIETLEPDPENILSNLVLFLYHMASSATSDVESKIHIFVGYVAGVLSQQTSEEFVRDPLVKHSQAFEESALSNIVLYLMQLIESKWASTGLHTSLPLVLQMFVNASRSLKYFNKIFQGLQEAIKQSSFPLVYLERCCRTSIPAEQLALICEKSIERAHHLDPSLNWKSLHPLLHIPDTDESTFVRHCLSHCLVYTLYTHATARLDHFAERLELRIMIGEQIGIWIESLNLEGLEAQSEKYS
jgi:hypothetical protein